MSLSQEEVKKIASLAKLELTEAEIADQTKTLSNILSYISQLNELDTEGVEPITGPLELKNVMRVDEIKASSSELLAKIQENYPDKEDTAVKVPKMSAAK
jgi:aspartyl-tRNA(Asn)/glutamyl-tRNA(Gln) amidotransferase subunit C